MSDKPDEPAAALARALASPIRKAPARALGRRFRRRLKRVRKEVLAVIERADTGAEGDDDALSPDRAEWVSGNRHVIVRAADQTLEDMSKGFFSVLPRSPDDETVPRAERIAVEIVARTDGFVDEHAVLSFVRGFQSVTALDTSELWALPPFLRLVLLERLLGAAAASTPEGVRASQEVAACVTSLRTLEHVDWPEIVESLSVVERCFRRLDPARAYRDMDRRSRDRYRAAVEELARWSGQTEIGVAMKCVALAGEEGPEHVGAFLVGARRPDLEAELDARLPVPARGRRLLFRNAGPVYFGLVALFTMGATALPLLPLLRDSVALPWLLLAGLLVVPPSMSVALAITNAVLTRLVPPRPPLKLDFTSGVPAAWRTCVAVPTIFHDADDVESVLRQFEQNFIGNADDNLVFALLADPPDADAEIVEADAALFARAEDGIRALNRRYGESGTGPFVHFVRPRRWNPREDRWMAWERKRGKLHELNRLILGDETVDLRMIAGHPASLEGVRFVFTLDADTFVPQGVAARLAGTLAHPLNRPRFDAEGQRLQSGYTVLQPRVETLPGDDDTWFTRIFQPDEGLDLYSHAVSDIYQDLFGEAVYVGKGLYDVAAFERSLDGRVPENALLSHDLFEGVHGRTALVSDTAVIEDFPSTPLGWMRRLHRWVRGDWQIIPWLLPRVPTASGEWRRNRLPGLARWMIADNLRRSLVFPFLLFLAVLGWFLLPGGARWWTLWILAFPGVPVLLAAVGQAPERIRRWPTGAIFRRSWRPAWRALGRWASAAIFLPWRALTELDAIVRTLARLTVSRRRLLEWTTAAHTTRTLAGRSALGRTIRPMTPVVLVSALLGVALSSFPQPDPTAAILLALTWVASPAVAWLLGRRRHRPRKQLTDADGLWLRRLARRTWAYFERSMEPEEHWLPPDNIQFEPDRRIAHRTSPTNIGLGILSVAAAHELGHVTLGRTVATLTNVFETLERLERHRGHFLNWYRTHDLHALAPRYVSSVDSGNLAACLVTVGEALGDFEADAFPREADVAGLADTLEVTAETVREAGLGEDGPSVEPLYAVARRLREMAATPQALPAALEQLSRDLLPPLERATSALVETERDPSAAMRTGEIRGWMGALRRQLMHLRDECRMLLPANSHLPTIPDAVRAAPPGALRDAWTALAASLPGRVSLQDGLPAIQRIRGPIEALHRAVGEGQDLSDPDRREVLAWIREVERDLDDAEEKIRTLRAESFDLRTAAVRMVEAMDFRFLYDRTRRLLHVGYNVDAAGLDRSYYDLYASEARLASYIGVAKGELPVEHWLELGRPFGRRKGATVLLSWAGTMFEYLMPALFFRVPPGSLADLASTRAIETQIAFAGRYGVPWGVSESGYAETDSQGDYRYRAFGVPALALRHDRGDDPLVVAPYASALALIQEPDRALRNLKRLGEDGLLGPMGLFEAVDFGRGARQRSRPRIVRSSMAHHQGMIVGAIHHVLTDGAMPRRFHRDSVIAALDYLLHEQSPAIVRTSAAPPTAPRRTLPSRPVQAQPWIVDAEAFPPPSMVLSNGSLSTLVTATGGGSLRWKGRDVLRWRPDPTVQGWGLWIYLRDARSGEVWSVGRAPTWDAPDRYEALFSGEAVELHRNDDSVRTRTIVAVSPGTDVEIRRVTVVNEGPRPRAVELTSLGEVALANPSQDRRHPAFARLFVEVEFERATGTLLFNRRAEGLDEQDLWMAHAVVASSGELVRWEVDRSRFLRRGGDLRRPPGVVDPLPGQGEVGPWAPLDPVASLTWKVDVPEGEEVSVSFLTAAGPTRESVVRAIAAHRSPGAVQWALERGREEAREAQAELGLQAGELPQFQRLVTALAFPYHRSRAPALDRSPVTDGGARAALWSIGVSGDVPVLVLRAPPSEGGELLASLLRAHRYWERHGVRYDFVVVGAGSGDTYQEPLGGWLSDALARAGRSEVWNRPAGIHYVPADRVGVAEKRRIEEAASLVLDGSESSLAAALSGIERELEHLPPFVPVPSAPSEAYPTTALEPPDELEYFNGIGGFDPDQTAYVMHLEQDVRPPAPWINVVAHERFGFIASEAGMGTTWDGNSGERRLTPWSNDPVLDPPGEALYLRDEETGAVWSPTPGPAGGDAPCRVTHRPGSTTYLRRSHGLEQTVELFLAGEERAKVVEVRLRNLLSRPRRITLTYFVEWVLGSGRPLTAPHLVTDFEEELGTILAFDRLQPAPVGFLAADTRVHGFTCDRAEFLGVEGRRDLPEGLRRIGLASRTGPGLDPCGALQVHLGPGPDEEQVVRFFLGAVEGRDELRGRLSRLRDTGTLDGGRQETRAFWTDLLERTTVRTPERSMDHLLNGWLRYQALACRLWGRTGFYQSSGAFGFRDQLQDGLGLLSAAPEFCRQRILDAASRQFREGDVLHWWHPETGHGVRTRCSDDLYWLPFVTAAYVSATGDEGVLDERVPFLGGPILEPDEVERYGAFESTEPAGTVHEHCLRALDRPDVTSPRGVPLIGSGDWNDGLNRVGVEGRGESFWLGWFLGRVCRDYAVLCERLGEEERAAWLRKRADRLRKANEEHGWDGAWYRRATYDDGTPLGSTESVEGSIDSLSQSWAILSGLGDPERGRQAMGSVWEELVDRTSRLVLLLKPPFHDTPRQPGYIKSYPPGVRENGGQYTHAATWVGWAFAELGDGDRAEEIFRLLNPVLRTTTPEEVRRYRVEPYVVAGDVYGGTRHAARGGWTWYTGSASWLYRLGMEAILGLRFRSDGLYVDPCIPRSWKRFLVEHRYGDATYHVLVGNPDHVSRGVRSVTVDGDLLDGQLVPLVDDGAHHHVVVTLGRRPTSSDGPPGEG